jgi:hypothetical protein
MVAAVLFLFVASVNFRVIWYCGILGGFKWQWLRGRKEKLTVVWALNLFRGCFVFISVLFPSLHI